MLGEINEVRAASVRSADASKGLVAAGEKLMAEIARAEARVLELDAKSDRLSMFQKNLEAVSEELRLKEQALAAAKAAYAGFLAQLPK